MSGGYRALRIEELKMTARCGGGTRENFRDNHSN